jgi:acetyl esterase
MPLDSHSAALLSQLGCAGAKPLHTLTPEQARAASRAMLALMRNDTPMHRVEDFDLAYAGGSFRARLLVPVAQPGAVIVYYHGGGWTIGDIDGYEPMARALAAASECSVLLVDYRLAPEHPFPIPVEDAYFALEWAHRHLPDVHGKALPLIVAGDSAGGNLATVVALRSRDRAGPAIAMQVLVYPVTAADFELPSYNEPSSQLLLTREAMIWFWNHYLPDPHRRMAADASPMHAETLKGLPPSIVITAGHDPLRDEGEAYAARLIRSGVPIIFSRKADQMHGFFNLVGILPASRQCIEEIAAGITATLARPEVT